MNNVTDTTRYEFQKLNIGEQLSESNGIILPRGSIKNTSLNDDGALFFSFREKEISEMVHGPGLVENEKVNINLHVVIIIIIREKRRKGEKRGKERRKMRVP